MSRRQFLTLLGASSLGVLAACTPGREATTGTTGLSTTSSLGTTTTPLPDDIWSLWDAALHAVRASPDHLTQRAADLATTGDVDAILRFVAGEIVTYPPRADGFANAVTQTRWGRRGVLRCGAGTPREKAELLSDILHDAGLDAEVVMGKLEDDGLTMLRPSPDRVFAPGVDAQTLDGWLTQMGTVPSPIEELDPEGTLADELTSSLLSRLSDRPGADPAFSTALDLVPLVRVSIDGRESILDPSTPGATAIDSSQVPVSTPPPPSPLPSVEVDLAIATSDHPGSRITVASGSWPLDRLVGRRLIARFLPAGDLAAALSVPAIQLSTFTPVLTVDGPDLSVADAAADAILGDLVTVTGSVFTESDGSLAIDDVPVGVSTDPTASDIASIGVEVNPSAFPWVRLRVAVADAGGAPVLGISGDAFSVLEDDVPVPFVLRQATPPPPRVLLLFDGSTSIPDAFRGDGRVAFGTAMAQRLFAEFPGALLRVAGVNYGLASPSPSWMSDADEVATEMGRLITDGSELWSALADARGLGATVIAVITDGDATDPVEGVPGLESQVATGPPVIAVGVGEVNDEGLAALARVSGGAAVPGGSPEEATDAIAGYLADRDQTPVHIEYQSSPDGSEQRTVRVRTANAENSAVFVVPAPSQRAAPPSLTGIYLVVRMSGQEVVSTLAGVPVEGASSTSVITPELANEVRAAMFGVALLSVEAGAPTLAAWFDDILTSRLSLRPLVESDPSPEGVVAALSEAVHHLPAELVTLHAPMPAGDRLTFETGPRFVLLARRPLFDGGAMRRSDILSFTRFATADPDPVAAYAATLRASTRLAVAEAAIFSDSTISRLRERALDYLGPVVAAPREGPNAGHARLLDRWAADHRWVPADGGSFAFWAASRMGSLLGVLPDGSGGGSSFDGNAQCSAMNQAFSALDLLGWAGGLPFAFGAFLALGKAIAKQALREAAIIASLGGEMPDTSQCGNGLRDVPCDLAKDLISGTFKPLEALSVAEKMSGAAGGGDFFSC
ncbi:MAG: hypothetical protein WCA93_05655 [Acidimicrobiia bacterium]